MKKPNKKPVTPKAITSALDAAGFKVRKVEPANTVKISQAARRKTARAAERRKAKLVTLPQEHKCALKNFGLGAAQPIIKKRGRYYTAAGIIVKKEHGLKVRHHVKNGQKIDVQNVYAWRRADKKGWYHVTVNGEPRKKLTRWNDLKREQRAAWDKEKIRVVAEKTGLSRKAVRAIKTEIRKAEAKRLKRFKKTAKYKRLSAAEKRRNTVSNRVLAVWGALCDLLEVYGSPDTKPDDADE